MRCPLLLVLGLMFGVACAAPVDLIGESEFSVTIPLRGRVLLPEGERAEPAKVLLTYRSQTIVLDADQEGSFHQDAWNVVALPLVVEVTWQSADQHIWHTRREFTNLAADSSGSCDLGLLELEHTTTIRGRFVRPEYEIYAPWIVFSGGGIKRQITAEYDGSFVLPLWPTSAQPIKIEAYVGEFTNETSEKQLDPIELGPQQRVLDIGELRMREIPPSPGRRR